MANVNNTNRAIDFIKRARQLETNASPREILWIEAYHTYFTGEKTEADRCKDLIKALETIIRFAHEQKILPRPVTPDGMFAANTLDLA